MTLLSQLTQLYSKQNKKQKISHWPILKKYVFPSKTIKCKHNECKNNATKYCRACNVYMCNKHIEQKHEYLWKQ